MTNIKSFKIDNITIGINEKVFIIAEIGATHNGDLNQAFKLIDAAKDSGAQAVKLQTVVPDFSYCSGTLSHDIFTQLAFSIEELSKIKEYCLKKDIIIFTTPGDFPSLEMVKNLNLPLVKISSGLMNNLPLVEEVAKLNKPTILSTGMAYMHEVEKSCNLITKYNKSLVVLHCVSSYPSADSKLNLNAIKKIASNLNLLTGFSDHTYDEHAASIAVALGAVVLEKHLALSDDLAGPEKGIACTPSTFKLMVQKIRRTEKMLGMGEKVPMDVEMQGRKLNRRTIISTNEIKKGEEITTKNIALMRGTLEHVGLNPEFYEQILGLTAIRNIEKNEPIKLGMLSE